MESPVDAPDAAGPARRALGRRVGVVLALLAIVGFSSWTRTHLALRSPRFDRASDAGMLLSDPGLLYYLTERVVEAGGGTPDDWRADPRIEHPDVVDVPATFTVGQEFLVAWCRRVVGDGEPLHVLCVRLFAIIASLAAIGVYLLGAELGRARWIGLLAAAFYALLPANYRTVGFILIREDLSLPLFALHLGLLARAARVRTSASYVASGLALGAAVATWHAMGFVVALEALCVLAWFLWTDRNALAARRAWIVPAVLALFALVVPALAARRVVLSLPLQVAAGLLVAARVPAAHPLARRGAALATLVILIVVSIALGTGDFGHVFGVLAAKLYYFGELPADPRALSFEARMMWQGPFATAPFAWFPAWFHASLWMGLAWIALRGRALVRRTGTGARAVLLLLLLASLPATWLVERMSVLPGLLLPVAAALLVAPVARWVAGGGPTGRTLIAAGALVAHAFSFSGWYSIHQLAWYSPPRQAEVAAMVRALPDHVPEGEAVAADFMNSTAVLAHTRRPIVLQPKWETEGARERVRLFWETFYNGSPEDLRRLLTERYRCRWLLVDRYTLGLLRTSRYLGGLPMETASAKPGTAAAVLLSARDEVLRSAPGFELVWRSSPELRLNGQPTDFFRLFRLSDR